MPAEISKSELDLAWELTNGTIRYLKKIDYIAQSFVKAPVHKQKKEILAALRIGLYQLTETSGIPDFAAVSETVALIKDSLTPKDAGFVNAVLRNYSRESVKYPDKNEDPVSYLSVFYSYPEWLVKRWLKRFGMEETELILRAGNVRPTPAFKVMTGRVTPDAVLQKLRTEGIEAEKSKFLPDYIRCREIASILKSNAFKSGLLNVQDESQGLAVNLLNVPQGETVLDLCSAPGGKSIALADSVGPTGKVLSLDNSSNRLNELKENIKRIGFENIEIIEKDLFEFAPAGKFGYILLDVPCSGLGTIASRADLRWAKSENDIRKLSELQKRMLRKASTLLDDNGVLVYSTCTTEPEEIEQVVFDFLKANPGFELEDGNTLPIVPFKYEVGIYRSWMHKHGTAGGGFARLTKKHAK